MNEILRAIEAEQMRNDLPNFRIGDTVKLHVKIKEGNRERIQMFEGTVIKRQNGGLRETFTVRRLAYGVGVERTFPVNSPIIEKMEVTRRGKVRRAKLFYLRDRVGKAAKTKENVGAKIESKYIDVKATAEEVPAVEETVAPAEEPAVEAPATEATETEAPKAE